MKEQLAWIAFRDEAIRNVSARFGDSPFRVVPGTDASIEMMRNRIAFFIFDTRREINGYETAPFPQLTMRHVSIPIHGARQCGNQFLTLGANLPPGHSYDPSGAYTSFLPRQGIHR